MKNKLFFETILKIRGSSMKVLSQKVLRPQFFSDYGESSP